MRERRLRRTGHPSLVKRQTFRGESVPRHMRHTLLLAPAAQCAHAVAVWRVRAAARNRARRSPSIRCARRGVWRQETERTSCVADPARACVLRIVASGRQDLAPLRLYVLDRLEIEFSGRKTVRARTYHSAKSKWKKSLEFIFHVDGNNRIPYGLTEIFVKTAGVLYHFQRTFSVVHRDLLHIIL